MLSLTSGRIRFSFFPCNQLGKTKRSQFVLRLKGEGRTNGCSRPCPPSLTLSNRIPISALGEIDAEEAVPALAKALADADVGVRRQAAKTLGDIGARARAAVPSLRKALVDPDEAVRSEATMALGKIGA